MRNRWLSVAVALLFIAVGFAGHQALAQTTGMIEGTIADANDSPLPGASVEIKSTSLQGVRSAVTGNEGRFRFQGAELRDATPDRIARLGIARTFQNIRLFNNLSALENVMIGRHVRTHAGVFGAILRGPGTRAEERAIEKRAHELLEPPWMGTSDLPERELIQGMIKLAAAFVHDARSNAAGSGQCC